MANVLGSVVLENWHSMLRTVPTGSEPVHWVTGPPPGGARL